MKKYLIIFITSLLATNLFAISVARVYAAGNFYLSPASKSVSQGASFAVAIRVNSSSPINAVQANLSYPADKLNFVSISSAGSAFALQVESSAGNGSVRIARGLIGTTSGDKLIATVTFRAKVNSGSAVVSFAGGTQAVNSSGGAVVTASSGGTYTFTNPPPPPPPPPPPDTVAPKISDVKVTATSFKGATIEWKTDEDATSAVEFGVNTKYGLAGETAGVTKAHKVTIVSEILIAGVTYHFRVKSADSAGNASVGQDGTFKTKGYLVRIKVVDNQGKPVQGAKVTLASEPQTTKTDKAGIATFSDVAAGKHLVTVETGGKVQTSSIDVKESTEKEIAEGKVATQSFETKVTSKDFLLYYLALVALGIVLLSMVGYLGYKRFWKKSPTAN